MSQEIRNLIIAENILNLIKSLLASSNEKSNADASAEAKFIRTCENFAWNQIKYQRFTCVNSHEVRHNIEEIVERFIVENLPDFAAYIRQLCKVLVEHIVCLEHYETDIQWSVIDFLLTLARKPISTIRRCRSYKNLLREKTLANLWANDAPPGRNEAQEIDDWVRELQQDFRQLPRVTQSDDELSDWSTNENEFETVQPEKNQTIIPIPTISPKQAQLELRNIQPPKLQSQFTVYELTENCPNLVHNHWRHRNVLVYTPIESKSIIANFAIAYVQHLNDLSNNLISFQMPSTSTEYYLLREIIMMFFAPVDCGYFTLHDNIMKLRPNVTINSVTLATLQDYLTESVLLPLQMMHELNQYIRGLECGINQTRTIAEFGSALRKLLQPVKNALVAFEQRFLHIENGTINTLVTFRQHMRNFFKTLKLLHTIARRAQELPAEAPAHVKSMFLLALLLELASDGCGDNRTCAALLIYTFKIYANMLDSWWRIGCLHDWQNEYIVEYDLQHTMILRNFKSDAAVPTHIITLIEHSPLYKLLNKHSLESGYTQSLLYELKHIDDMFANSRDLTEPSLNDELIKQIFALIISFSSETELNVGAGVPPTTDEADNESQSLEDLRLFNQLTTTEDEHLLGGFYTNITCDNNLPSLSLDLSICELVTRLNEVKRLPPLQDVFLNALRQVLGKRNQFINAYVMSFYRCTVRIQSHVLHIRNVLLLQANFAMYTFYAPLFKKIETYEPWSNSAVLSMKLDDIVSEYFPDMSALVRIDLQSLVRLHTDKVYLAIPEITMTYDLNPPLARVISQQNIDDYNKVLHLLLCVKWAVWKLESLRFPRKPRQNIYSPLKLEDLLMRRLEQLRCWIIYVINTVHFHLCTNVVMAMGKQFERELDDCQNLYELKQLHKSYLNTICTRCLVTEEFDSFRSALNQFFNLIYVLNLEWHACVAYIEKSHGLCLETSNELNYINGNAVDDLESTYIRCHHLLARIISEAVNVRGHAFLNGLELCISHCVPY